MWRCGLRFPTVPDPASVHRAGTRVMSVVLVLLGVALLVSTVARGGGPFSVGVLFGLLLGGAIVTETVFAVPGVGRLIVGAIRQLDFPIVQAGVFLFATIVVVVNFAVDLLYICLNPQIRVR